MSFQLSASVDENKIFLVNRSELGERLDPKVYNAHNIFLTSFYDLEQLSKHFLLNPRANFGKESEFTFIPMENVCEETASIKKYDAISESQTKGFTPFQEGDFIFAKITPCMENGKMAIAEGLPRYFAFGSTEFFVLREKSGLLSVHFLRILFLLNGFRELAKNNFVGAAGQQRVPSNFLKRLHIPIPPKEMQAEIVAKMDAAYAAKKQKEAEAQALLDSIDDYLLGELGIALPAQQENTLESRIFTRPLSEVSGGRFDAVFYSPPYTNITNSIKEVPHEKLGHIVRFSNESWDQKSIFANTFPYIEIGEIDLVLGEVKNISQVSISEAPSRAKMIVRSGDIIVSTTRPNRGAIVKINGTNEMFVASTGFSVIREVLRGNVDPLYLYYMLRQPISLKQMEQRSSGGNYPAITQEELSEIIIPIPIIEEQKEITRHITQIRQQAKQLQEQAKAGLAQAKKEVEAMILGEGE